MLAVCAALGAEAKPTVKTIASPDGKLVVTVTVADDIRWSVEADGRTVLAPSQIAMQISDSETWGEAPRLRKAVVGKIDETVEAPLYKKAEVEDKCTTLTLQFKGDYAVEFRAYDNAAAYRFVSTRKGDYTVKDEVAEFAFEGDNNVYCSYVRGNANKSIEQQYYNSFENTYEIEPMSKMGANRLMFLPVLVDMGDRKVCITESDLMSYPGMYLYNPDGGTALKGNYAPVPDEVKQGGHNMLQGEVQTRKPYIAEVSGERSFPWRICIVADSDAELLNNDMVFLLSHPNVIGDTSWIEPGKVAWEWWNDWGLYGVDFKPGIDNRTYKYYIDFAAEHPDETLIIVTADHETGGMTIGFATTAYDTHFNYLENQTISWVQFDDVITEMRENDATFEDALAEIETYYGLTTEEGQDLTLTEAEIESLQAAFELSMLPAEERVLGDEEALLYGGYEPLSMAVCHIINNKAGLSFTSYAHTGLQIPVYATGVGADNFAGLYDNTDIFTKTMTAMGLQADA